MRKIDTLYKNKLHSIKYIKKYINIYNLYKF